MKTIVQITLSAAVLAIVLASLCLFSIDATEYAVVTRFGQYVREIKEPGLYAKWPTPIGRVHRFDRRLQILTTPLVQYLTRDSKSIALECYVTWQIDDARTFMIRIESPEVAAEKLMDTVESEVGATVGEFEMSSFFGTGEDRTDVHGMEQRMAGNVARSLSAWGIGVRDIGISRLALSEDNAQSVYDRMRAEREAKARGIRSEGMMKAAEITADAERKKSDTLAGAYKQAEIIKGTADAEAARIYAQAHQNDPEFYEFLRTLEAYEKILEKDATVVLPLDSDLFKLLRGKQK